MFNIPAEPVIAPAKQDKRFKNEAWTENWFFDYTKQHYLLLSRCIESSVRNVKGVDPHTHHKGAILYASVRQRIVTDQFRLTNPAVLNATVETRGENLLNGFRNLVEDLERGGGRLSLQMSDVGAFQFGENIANSPGKVVFQNELMQLPSICAVDTHGAAPFFAHRAALDQQILYPGSQAEELFNQMVRGPGSHGFRDLLG